MSLNNPQEDNMCTEEDIKQINQHTDQVGGVLHHDYTHLADRVDKLETKFVEDVREIFGQLRDIRKSIFTTQWTSVGITCGVLLTLFGLLFNWLWSQDQMRSQQIAEMSRVIGAALANEQVLVNSVKSIEDMVKDELNKNGEEHEEDLEDHLKYYHEE